MKQVFKYNASGFYVEPVIIGDEDQIPANCTELQPPHGLYKAQFTNGQWHEGMDSTVLADIQAQALKVIKDRKQEELEAACSAELTYGYLYTMNGVSYRFSFDIEAQANFMGALRLLESGKATTVPWTAYNGTERMRIDLTLDDLHNMELEQFNHKNTITGKYNDLLINHLYPATDEGTVRAIVWG